MPGLPVHHQLPEPTQTDVYRVSDTIQPSHSLSSPSPPAFNLPQRQGLFPWVNPSHQGGQSIGASASASVLPMNIQDWFPLGLLALISLPSKGLSRVFSNTTVQKHRFFGAQLSLWSTSHIPTWLLGKPQLWQYGPVGKVITLPFNMLSRLVIIFLPMSKCLWISWLIHNLQWFWSPKK